jgi:hypothetical protein
LVQSVFEMFSPSPLAGEGWGEGEFDIVSFIHPHPNPPPSRGRELTAFEPKIFYLFLILDSDSWILDSIFDGKKNVPKSRRASFKE